jgi:signal transduction histidine kinase
MRIATPRRHHAWQLMLWGLGTALAAVTVLCAVDSTVWVDRPFQGFVMGRNRIVAPIGLGHWAGFRADVPFGGQLTHADGAPVTSVPSLVERVWTMAPGTPVSYRFATRTGEVARTVPVMRFTLIDYLGLFGVLLANGLLFLGLGLLVAALKPARAASAVLLAFCVAWGLTLVVSAADFYRFRFRDLYAVAQAAAPAALVLLALTFPDRPLPRRRGWLLGGLGAVTLAHAAADIVLYERAPLAWMRFFDLSLAYGMLAAVVACVLLRWRYVRADAETRARLQVVAVGAVVALGLPAAVQLCALAVGETLPVNLIPLITGLFPLAVAYAVLKHDVLGIDPLLTRSVFYALLTTVVTVAWIVLLGIAHATSPDALRGGSAWLPFLFALGVVAVAAPLRRAVQRTVDRLFFRTRYDVEAAVEDASRSLSGSLDRDQIAAGIRRMLGDTVAPAPCLVLLPDRDALRAATGETVAADDPALRTAPGPGAAVVPLEAGASVGATRLAGAGATLLVPLRLEDRLEGLLALGPKRSGAPWGARDLTLLRTLGNQAAIALRNAASYAELRELTATLEDRVAARTADLARTQAQLAQADKLASLGRLVAGIAHEINNPVAFVSASVDLIHDAAVHVRSSIDGRGDPALVATLTQLLENAAICRDGAARAARIVRDLQAFARPRPNRREPVDVHAALERTLQLLRGEYKERITIVREFGNVPLALTDPGELDQVLMNLLANAVQAIDGTGDIRLRTWAADGTFVLVVRDSGRGIPLALQERIFEPFFTTRTGRGSGLGLAIANSLVTRQGGTIRVSSTPGAGASFTVRLPLAAIAAPAS